MAILIALLTSFLFFHFLNKTPCRLINLCPNKTDHRFFMRRFFSLLSYKISELFHPSFLSVLSFPFFEDRNGLAKLPKSEDGISFSQLQLAYRNVSFGELDIEGKHEIREDSVYFPAGQIASISWQGITGEKANLTFLPTSRPVSVEVSWDGRSQELGLQSQSSYLPAASIDFPTISYETTLVYGAVLSLVLLALFILVTGLFSPYPMPVLCS
jgi:hypothetical protein